MKNKTRSYPKTVRQDSPPHARPPWQSQGETSRGRERGLLMFVTCAIIVLREVLG